MKKTYYISGLIISYSLWIIIIIFLLNLPIGPDYPIFRARFGTIMHHSSDNSGKAHTYCYYPRSEARSNIILKRLDNDDCSKWYGQVVFYEGQHVSEREKYWWSEEQHIKDCGNCDDLRIVAKME